jgi:hypothetical protein
VIVAGQLGGFFVADMAVFKLDGTDGTEIWRQEVESTQTFGGTARDVVTDANGDVIAVGHLLMKGAASEEFAALKLSGTDGSVLWRHLLGGSAKRVDGASAVAVDSNGDVFAAGGMREVSSIEAFVTAKLAKADGVIGPIDGHKLLVIDDSSNPASRKIIGIAKESSLVLPEPGSTNDPTVAGATVTLSNPDTAESAVFVLPGGPEWKGLGNPAGSKGYKYKDKDGTHGPCGRLIAKPNQLVKVVCKGAAVPFTLDEPTQMSLSLGIQFGTAHAQCAVFGGDLVARDEGTSNPGPKGTFRAKKGPAVDGNCP